MTTRNLSTLSRIALGAVLAASLGAAAAQAREVPAAAAQQITVGASQDQVRSQFGEPLKVASYLFVPGAAWFYHVDGGNVGAERVVEVRFDGQGQVQSTQLMDAAFYGLNEFDAS